MTRLEIMGRVETALLLVLDESDQPDLSSLTKDELLKIGKWAAVMALEASDNPCRARQAPKSLRRLLPARHYLQKWRAPKRRAAR